MPDKAAALRALDDLLRRVLASPHLHRAEAAALGLEALRIAASVSVDLAIDTLLALLHLGLTAEELAAARREPGAPLN